METAPSEAERARAKKTLVQERGKELRTEGNLCSVLFVPLALTAPLGRGIVQRRKETPSEGQGGMSLAGAATPAFFLIPSWPYVFCRALPGVIYITLYTSLRRERSRRSASALYSSAPGFLLTAAKIPPLTRHSSTSSRHRRVTIETPWRRSKMSRQN